MSDALDANWAECYKLADLVADRRARAPARSDGRKEGHSC
jgi:hypothetical protein